MDLRCLKQSTRTTPRQLIKEAFTAGELQQAPSQLKVGKAAVTDGIETQPDNALEPATWRALIRHSSRPPPIQHKQLKEVNTSLCDEQIETSFAKTERIDLARFRSGLHSTLRRWQHLAGISEDVVCRLCGEEVNYAEH